MLDNDKDLTLFSLPTTLSVDLMYGDGATGSDIFLWTGLFLIAGFSVTDDRLSSFWTLLPAEIFLLPFQNAARSLTLTSSS